MLPAQVFSKKIFFFNNNIPQVSDDTGKFHWQVESKNLR